MANLYRLVSPEKLELYDLKRSGKLHFVKTIVPSNFNFKKIRLLILSAYYTNWDTTRIENTAYQPRNNVNLFAARSIFEKENLIITPPYRNVSTGFWAQAWAPNDKLLSILKNISKKASIYAESLTISARDNSVFWQSGPVILNGSDKTGFTDRHSPEAIQDTIAENLDGFEFKALAEFNLFSRKKSYALMLAGFALLASMTFSWEFSVKEVVKNNRTPALVFDNRLPGLPMINAIQEFVPNGAAKQVSFDQRTQETLLTFTSKEKALNFFKIISNSPKIIGEWSISIENQTVVFKESGDQ